VRCARDALEVALTSYDEALSDSSLEEFSFGRCVMGLCSLNCMHPLQASRHLSMSSASNAYLCLPLQTSGTVHVRTHPSAPELISFVGDTKLTPDTPLGWAFLMGVFFAVFSTSHT